MKRLTGLAHHSPSQGKSPRRRAGVFGCALNTAPSFTRGIWGLLRNPTGLEENETRAGRFHTIRVEGFFYLPGRLSQGQGIQISWGSKAPQAPSSFTWCKRNQVLQGADCSGRARGICAHHRFLAGSVSLEPLGRNTSPEPADSLDVPRSSYKRTTPKGGSKGEHWADRVLPPSAGAACLVTSNCSNQCSA